MSCNLFLGRLKLRRLLERIQLFLQDDHRFWVQFQVVDASKLDLLLELTLRLDLYRFFV